MYLSYKSQEFIQEVATTHMEMTREDAEHVGGQIFLSGSHKLGIREPGADIDTICVAPNFCSKQLFFTVLRDKLTSHPLVTNFQSVEDARVSIASIFVSYSLTPSPTHLLTYLLTHSLTHSLTYLLTPSLTHSLTYLLTPSLTHLLTYLLTHSLTYLLTHSLTNSLTHSLIHSIGADHVVRVR